MWYVEGQFCGPSFIFKHFVCFSNLIRDIFSTLCLNFFGKILNLRKIDKDSAMNTRILLPHLLYASLLVYFFGHAARLVGS